ncbi:hypothetical protein GPECTOR_1g706 [Gonium pectorale]|uniref:Protein kinase domain-containing protein n=1 Tax=Gonium pectorale TaxID=33097 RepID=A0A150H3Z3_GONPE|nr:hypothetical protein GPECTOR_1g706 [Gonium pectorale]|eukprot:KXZ56784.1 hypothetical protein GPECTOR_1g706 [Gonium pectorale]
MLSRRKSLDEPGAKPKDGRLHNALLKLSTANAFAKSQRGLSLDDFPPSEPSPEQLSPYYGLYADYEDVMELLHTAAVADGAARRHLGSLIRQQVVHVAHLGIGACCSVDLVALHTADGGRLLAAAKSCYLPPSDPRMRASLREAELLRRCADCPFIVQLLAVVQDPPEEVPQAAGAHGAGGDGGVRSGGSSPSSFSPHDSFRRNSFRTIGLGGDPGSASAAAAAAAAAGYDTSFRRSSESMAAVAAAAMDSQLAALQASPAYQAWAAWRGGGAEEDLQRQTMQRFAAGVSGSGGSFGAGLVRSGSVTGELLGPLGSGCSMTAGGGGWDSSPGASMHGGLGGGGAADITYGGGWAFGGGGGGGAVGAMALRSVGSDSEHGGAYGAGGRPRLQRRGSLEVIDMYRGALGQHAGLQGAAGGHAGLAAGSMGHHDGELLSPGSGGGEAPAMTTLLLGWARCGDLRRLVQLLLSRSPAHQQQQKQGGGGGGGLPPLMSEDAARFYTGCLVLALEHLHGRMHTVHRDLKLANLLLLSSGYAVVGDLGTAVDLSGVPGGKLNAKVGSPGHMAPECRDRDEAGYDTSADMWSLGACLFSLLTGQLPAGTAGPPGRSWSPPLSRHWSRELQDLMARLLAWSPAHRPTAAQLLRDPWFRGFNWAALRAHKMPAPSSTPWRELLWWPKENRHLL